MDWSQTEQEEHRYLEEWQETLGIEMDGENTMEMDDVYEHDYLDSLLMRMEECKLGG